MSSSGCTFKVLFSPPCRVNSRIELLSFDFTVIDHRFTIGLFHLSSNWELLSRSYSLNLSRCWHHSNLRLRFLRYRSDLGWHTWAPLYGLICNRALFKRIFEFRSRVSVLGHFCIWSLLWLTWLLPSLCSMKRNILAFLLFCNLSLSFLSLCLCSLFIQCFQHGFLISYNYIFNLFRIQLVYPILTVIFFEFLNTKNHGRFEYSWPLCFTE